MGISKGICSNYEQYEILGKKSLLQSGYLSAVLSSGHLGTHRTFQKSRKIMLVWTAILKSAPPLKRKNALGYLVI